MADSLTGGLQSLAGVRRPRQTTGGLQTLGSRPRQQQQQPQPAQTFAQMQQQGMARPAPQAPPVINTAQYGGSNQANTVRNDLQQSVSAALQNPSRYDTNAFRQIRDAQRADLDAAFQGQQKNLNTEMARRGLSQSTAYGNDLSGLMGSQARGYANIDASLLQDAAATQATDRNQAMTAAQQLAALAGTQDMATYEANRAADASNNQANLADATLQEQIASRLSGNALDAAKAAQSGQLDRQKLGLDTTLGLGNLGISQREQALKELQNSQQFGANGTNAQNLALEYAKLNQQGQQFTQGQAFTGTQNALDRAQQMALQQGSQGFEGQQNALQRALQEKLQGNELGVEQQKIANQASQFGQSLTLDQQKLALDQMVQSGQLTIAQKEQALKELANSQQFGLDTQKVAQQQGQFMATQAQEAEQNALQRALQEKLAGQTNSLEAQKIANQNTQFGQSLGLDKDKLQQDMTQFSQNLQQTQRNQEQQNTQYNKTLAEQIANRLYQGGLTNRELDIKAADTQANQKLAQNQLFMSLAQMLSGSPDAFLDALKKGTTATGGSSTTTTTPGSGGVPDPTTLPPNPQEGDTTSDGKFVYQGGQWNSTGATGQTYNPNATGDTAVRLTGGVMRSSGGTPDIGQNGIPVGTSSVEPTPVPGSTPTLEALISQIMRANAGSSGASDGVSLAPSYVNQTGAAPALSPYQQIQQDAQRAAISDGAANFGAGNDSLSSYQMSPNNTALSEGAGGRVFGPDGSPMAAPQNMTPEAQSRLASGWALQYSPNGGVQYLWTPKVNSNTLAINNGAGSVTAADGSAFQQALLNMLTGVR